MSRRNCSCLFVTLLLVGLGVAHGREIPQLGLSVNEKLLRAIERNVDATEDPCEDFYGYACKNWADHHTSEHYTEATGLIDHKTNKKLLKLVESYTPTERRDSLRDKVWTYYKSCKREKQFDYGRYLKLVRPAGQVNWPILERLKDNRYSWQRENFHWMLTEAKLHRYGMTNLLIEQLILPELEDNTKYMISLDKPTLTDNNKLPSKRKVAKLLSKIGVPEPQAKGLAEQLAAFEDRLEILLEIEDDYGMLEVTVRDMTEDMPELPWRKYFTLIMGGNVNEDFTIQIRNWDYFVNLAEYLAAIDAEIVCNYIMFKFLYYLYWETPNAFNKINCMVDVRSKMDVAMNYLYRTEVYEDIAEDYNAEVQAIFDRLRNEFLQIVDANQLALSSEELSFVRNKLNLMRLNIGNLPKDVDEQYVAAYYGGLVLDPKNYYKNHLALLEWRFIKEVNQLTAPDPFHIVSDSTTAHSSTPYYLTRNNVVIVPASFLQPPMFHKNMHEVFKISLFGFLIGHEIMHGFDASGVEFDHRGNTQNMITNISENSQFTAGLKCMQEKETENIDERIADIVGIRLAYAALFGADKNATGRAQQPGFTQIPAKRLFFLNFAQFFCGKVGTQFADHDSDDVRLQETLLNFEPFAEEFECDLGDVMHPERKCRLW